MSTPQREPIEPLTLLRLGEVALEGRLPWSSNGTFLARVCLADHEALAVYKPERGERPLWDFPPGLFRRELAAYVVSEALGWGLVPETVIREGPLGTGSIQRFVEANFDEHYFTLLEHPEHRDALVAIAVLDLLINNADRKSGHCLVDADGKVWAIDHGLCFHPGPKLRTVIWDFAGEEIPARLRDDVARLAVAPLPELSSLLEPVELDVLSARAAAIARLTRFPDPGGARPYPWPMV